MRSKKNGEKAIPKIIWEAKASAHLGFVQDLINAGLDGGLINKHASIAEDYARIAADTRKGRPADTPPLNALIATRRKPRKSNYDVPVFSMIENERQGKPVRRTITELLRKAWIKESGMTKEQYVLQRTEGLRAEYNRGKKKTVQK